MTNEEIELIVKKGERTKVLFELLMQELELEPHQGDIRIVVSKLNQVQQDYEEAIQNMTSIIRAHHTLEKIEKTHSKNGGVSVSNY